MGVRHERVVLTLEDKFSSGMARAAVAAGALDKELDSISKRAVVTSRAQAQVAQSVDRTDVSVRRATASIDRYSGRLGLLGDLVATLGPALSPIGASSVGLIGGLVNQLSVAVLAGGSAILAFQGVGEAMKAVNAAALDPSQGNIAKARQEMARLSPAARDAVRAMQEMKPLLADVQGAGAAGFMPGFVEALESLQARGGDVTRIVGTLSQVLGDLMADGASALASEGWDEFFDFLAVDSAQTLESMGRSVGNLAKGFSELWMAFDPLSDGFNDWLEDASAGFADWADGLSESERFQDFVDYIFKSGPQVTSSLTAMADAFLAVMEAASPLGGPVLAALEAVSEAISTIARSDLGTPIMTGVAALALFNRTAAITSGLMARGGISGIFGGSAIAGAGRGVKGAAGSIRADLAAMSSGLVAWGHDADKAGAAADRMKGRMASAGKAGAGIAGIGIAATGAADGMELANTATLGLMGTLLGPWGTAAGVGIGQLMDMAAANDEAANATDNLTEAIARQSGTATMSEYDALAAQYDDAATRVEDMAERLNDPSSFGDIGLGAKNAVEGIFGKSDYEEEFEKMEAARGDLAELREEAERLAQIDLEKQKWEEFAAAVDVSREAADATSASFLTLGETLNDPEVSLGGWLAELEANNEALKNFRVNSEEAAEKGLRDGLIKQLQEMGPEGARRMAELADASETEIKRANRAFTRGKRQTDAYAAAIAGIPPEVTTEIAQKGMPRSIADIERLNKKYDLTDKELETLVALSGVGEAEAELAGLTRTRTVRLQIEQSIRRSVDPVGILGNFPVPGITGRADGGTVPGQRAPYGDKTLIFAAPGEEVITNRNGEADRFRADRAAGRIPAYANGGTVGGLRGEGVYRSPLAFNGDQMRVGGVWRDFERGLKILTRTLDKSEKSLDKMRDRLEEVRDKMATAGSNSVDQFAADLWAGPSSPWSAGGSGPLAALSTSSADLRARRDLQLQLKRRGLKGDAYAAAMTGSNEDLRGLLSRDEVGKFQSAFDGNAKLQTVVASEAGKYAYGKQEAARIADVRGIKSEVKGLRKDMKEAERRQARRDKENADRTGKAAGKAVSKPAGRGAAKSKK